MQDCEHVLAVPPHLARFGITSRPSGMYAVIHSTRTLGQEEGEATGYCVIASKRQRPVIKKAGGRELAARPSVEEGAEQGTTRKARSTYSRKGKVTWDQGARGSSAGGCGVSLEDKSTL